MKIRAFLCGAFLAILLINNLTVRNSATLSAFAQGRMNQLNLSPEEQNLARAIMSAPDPAARLKAATELIKKYPKTVIRPRVASGLADQIGGVVDASQKISLAQQYQAIFNEPSEQELIVPVLIDGLVGANRPDEAFSAGANFLERNPDFLGLLV